MMLFAHKLPIDIYYDRNGIHTDVATYTYIGTSSKLHKSSKICSYS